MSSSAMRFHQLCLRNTQQRPRVRERSQRLRCVRTSLRTVTLWSRLICVCTPSISQTVAEVAVTLRHSPESLLSFFPKSIREMHFTDGTRTTIVTLIRKLLVNSNRMRWKTREDTFFDIWLRWCRALKSVNIIGLE